MRQATPELHEMARRLLAHEAGGGRIARDVAAAVEHACERLSEQIDPLIGAGGMRALVARALYLAKREFRWLDAVGLDETSGWSFKNLRGAIEGRTADEASRATAAILANIIWLLVTFIGDDITLRLVRETWAELPFAGRLPAADKGTKP